jgi:peptidoglycan-associated lipoprotein
MQARTPMRMKSPTPLLLCLAAAAALLAGCGSAVKLEPPAAVEDRSGKAVDPNAAGAGGSTAAGGGAAGQGGQSGVRTVDLGANAGAASTLERTVYFDFDSFVVRDDYRGTIEGHAKALSAGKGKRLVVEGHTDERGGREYNLALGQKRAEAVVRALALVGAPGDRLEAVSFGKERPAVEGRDEASWAKNRRAELKDK